MQYQKQHSDGPIGHQEVIPRIKPLPNSRGGHVHHPHKQINGQVKASPLERCTEAFKSHVRYEILNRGDLEPEGDEAGRRGGGGGGGGGGEGLSGRHAVRSSD